MAASPAKDFHKYSDIPGFYVQPDMPSNFKMSYWEDLETGLKDVEEDASVVVTSSKSFYEKVRGEAVVAISQKAGFCPIPGFFFCPEEVKGAIRFGTFGAGGSRIVLRIYEKEHDEVHLVPEIERTKSKGKAKAIATGPEDEGSDSRENSYDGGEDEMPNAEAEDSTSRIPDVSENDDDIFYIPKQQDQKSQNIKIRNDSEITKYPYQENGDIGQVFRFVNCGILSFASLPESTINENTSKTTKENSGDGKKKKTKPQGRIEDVEFRVSSWEPKLENFCKRLGKVAETHYAEVTAKKDPKTAPRDHGGRK